MGWVGDKGKRGWLTCLPECVLALNMRGAKGFFPDRFPQFSGKCGKEGEGKCLCDNIGLPHIISTFFFPT